MKRMIIIGSICIAAFAILIVGVALGAMVSPVRAQFTQRIDGSAQNLLLNSARAQTTGLQLKAETGILVAGVFQDSPADKAGLVRGDIISAVDGTAVNTDSDLRNILSQHKAGDTLSLTVERGDSQKTVSVTLAESPVPAQSAPQGGQQNPGKNGPRGMNNSFLTGPFLGIVPIGSESFTNKGQQTHGAVIAQVAAGSPAEKAGLKAGEMILAVDGTQINAQNSLSTLIGSHKPGDTIKLTVQGTDGAQREVSVTLADNPQKTGTPYLGVNIRGFGGGRGGFGSRGNGNSLNPNNFPAMAQHPGDYIQQVTQNSPAEKAGMKAGSVIESVDGKKVDSAQVLSDAISSHKPGDSITLSIYDPQANKTSDVKVTLGDNPQKTGSAWLGIQYRYFNLQNMAARPALGNGGTMF